MSAYAWAAGARLTADPDAVGRELERIRQENGKITPESVVRAARAKRSPLHPIIYDGTTAEEALREYRLQRAKYVLRSIEIVVSETQTVLVRGFQLVEINGEREYVPAPEVRDDLTMREQVRARLLRELISLKSRLKAWNEFAPVLAAIEDVLGDAA